ncbi:MAG: hypothetical protein HYY45_13825 [Deltaproteobacteria bacterium]|nr:hypothetical protein [Deltaproteobacteria bacterium]
MQGVHTRGLSEEYQEDLIRENGDLVSYGDIQAKFYDCSVPVIGEDQVRRIESLVGELERLKSVAILIELLRGARALDSGIRTELVNLAEMSWGGLPRVIYGNNLYKELL